MADVTITLSDSDMATLADLIAERLADRIAAPHADRWLSSEEAAEHLGVTLAALRHLKARLPHSQEGPGARVYFRASDLDQWLAERANGSG